MPRTPIDPLREAACLVHSVPGAVVRLRPRFGRSLLVSRDCLGADLDPCRFRAVVLARTGTGLAALVDGIDLVAGLVHLGGGLYHRTSEHGREERWFVTSLPRDRVVELVAGCPDPIGDRVEAVVKPDDELGLCTVMLAAARQGASIDEAAVWSLSACLVDELLADTLPESAR